MRTTLLALSIVVCASCAAQVSERTEAVGDFTSIEAKCRAIIHYTQGALSPVRLTGPVKELENLSVTVSDGRLVIKSIKGKMSPFKNEKQPHVMVSSPRLTGVRLTGVGDFLCEGPIKEQGAFELDVTGSADAKLVELSCGDLRVQVTGSGDCEVKRVTCGHLKGTVSGSGDLELGACSASGGLELTVDGSGDAEIKRVETPTAQLRSMGTGDLEATLAGTSDVTASTKGTGELDLTFEQCGNVTVESQGTGEVKLKGTARTLRKTKQGVGKMVDTVHLTGQ